MSTFRKAAAKVDPNALAKKVVETAKRLGYTITVGTTAGNIVTITKNFEPGDMTQFVDCDTTYYEVLSLIPSSKTNGSTWGTDGSGIGGMAAVKNGTFTMNKSACQATILKALLKQPGVQTRAW